MSIIPALSSYIPGLYAIQLDKDQSITNASEILQEKISNLNIIEYGSFKQRLLSHRIIEPIIWIGHGDKEGINTINGKLTWQYFSKDLFFTPSKDIILSCYSSEILKQSSLTDKNVITFNNEIDSIYGSLIISYLITGKDSLIMDAAHHFWSILKGDVEYQPLHELDPGVGTSDPEISQMIQDIANIPTSYAQAKGLQSYVIYKMSGIELGFHLMSLVILVIELVLACTLAPYQFSFLEAALIDFWVIGIVSFLTTIAYYAGGLMTESECIDEMLSGFSLIGECIYKAYRSASIIEMIIFINLVIAAGVITGIELFCDTLSAVL